MDGQKGVGEADAVPVGSPFVHPVREEIRDYKESMQRHPAEREQQHNHHQHFDDLCRNKPRPIKETKSGPLYAHCGGMLPTLPR